MNPGSGTDVAQTIRLGDDEAGGQFNLQWNDPYDLDGATYGPPLFTASGQLTTPTSSKTYTYNATVGASSASSSSSAPTASRPAPPTWCWR